MRDLLLLCLLVEEPARMSLIKEREWKMRCRDALVAYCGNMSWSEAKATNCWKFMCSRASAYYRYVSPKLLCSNVNKSIISWLSSCYRSPYIFLLCTHL